MESYSVITAPTVEPLTLAEVKTHLRVNNTLENDLITALITAARQWVEGYTMRPLMTQTLQANYDELNSLEILLNKFPIQSITSVKYIDTNGTEQTVNSSTYETDLISPIGRILLTSIPSYKKTLNAIKIRFVAGYTSADLVPKTYRSAMLLLIAHLYENKQQAQSQTLTEIPFGIRVLLDIDHNKYNRTIWTN